MNDRKDAFRGCRRIQNWFPPQLSGWHQRRGPSRPECARPRAQRHINKTQPQLVCIPPENALIFVDQMIAHHRPPLAVQQPLEHLERRDQPTAECRIEQIRVHDGAGARLAWASRFWDVEGAANLAGQQVGYLRMTGHRFAPPSLGIPVNRVRPALALKRPSVLLQVADEFPALHASSKT